MDTNDDQPRGMDAVDDGEAGQGIYIGGGALLIIVIVLLLILLL